MHEEPPTKKIRLKHEGLEFTDLPIELFHRILEFEPITLHADYFVPETQQNIKFWYGRYPHSSTIICIFPHVCVHFKQIHVTLTTPRYFPNSRTSITQDYQFETRKKNFDLTKWLPPHGILVLDLSNSMSEESISHTSLGNFTELIEYRTKEHYTKIYEEPYSLRQDISNAFFLSWRNIQVLNLSGTVTISIHDSDITTFPTTLRYLDMRSSCYCKLKNLNKIIEMNPNLMCLKATITTVDDINAAAYAIMGLAITTVTRTTDLDISSLQYLTHLELVSSGYPINRININFNTSLKSFRSHEHIFLTEKSAIELLHLPHLEELAMQGSYTNEVAFPTLACSHFEDNITLKKLTMNDYRFWNSASDYLAKCVNLEEIKISEHNYVLEHEKQIPYKKINDTVLKLPSLKRWFGYTNETWNELILEELSNQKPYTGPWY
jgi:hypothetical protein